MTTAHTFRVFPGEGVHSGRLAELVIQLRRVGYRGGYRFAVFNEAYLDLPCPSWPSARAAARCGWPTACCSG